MKPCPMCDVPGPLASLLDLILKDHCEILELGNDLLTRESLLTLVVDLVYVLSLSLEDFLFQILYMLI